MSLYLVTVHKNQGGIGGKPWVNSYEVITNGSLEETPDLPDNSTEILLLRRLAGDISDFEIEFHLNTTYINRVTVSTWLPDSTPYNGDELVSVPISAIGQRTIPVGQEALGLDDTLFVRKTPLTGELGKIMYRGVLLESDNTVNAQGIKTLNGASPVANGGSLWTAAAVNIAPGLMDYHEQGADEWAFCMVHQPTSETITVRPVLSFTPAGITPLKLNKRHYNRGAAAAKKEIEKLNEKLAVAQAKLAAIESSPAE